MQRLSHNILANFAGQVAAALLALAFVPVYIRILGVEAYGLIGFFVSVQALAAVLEVALSATVVREISASSRSSSHDEVRDFVRTLEYIYWPTGFLITLLILAASSYLATHWLDPVGLGEQRTSLAIAILGVGVGLQWPCSLYTNSLRGLDRQMHLNTVNTFFAVLRHAGSAAVISLISPSLEAFASWNATTSLLQAFALAFSLWRRIPGSGPPTARLQMVVGKARFTLSMVLIGTTSFLLTQGDKLILSRLLSLEEFGYYSLAATVAGTMSIIVQPLFSTFYPRFSRIAVEGPHSDLVSSYHQSNQLMAPLVATAGTVLALFSTDILLLWTSNPDVAERSSALVSLLICGAALNGLMHLPYALQLAYGWTRLSLTQNVVALCLTLPAIWWLARHYGAIGAAAVWPALNLGYCLATIPIVHRKLLKGEAAHWYKVDIIPPVLVALIAGLVLRKAVPEVPDGLRGVIALACVSAVILTFAAMSSPAARGLLIRAITRIKR